MPGWLKVVLTLVVAGGGAAGYLHLVDPDAGRALLKGTPLEPAPSVTTAYKWRDADGNWQLSDHPPPAGTPYEKLEARSDVNILPSIGRSSDKSPSIGRSSAESGDDASTTARTAREKERSDELTRKAGDVLDKINQ